MVNAVFAKMDTYQRYGNQESLDMMKLYGGNPTKSIPSARSGQDRRVSQRSSNVQDDGADSAAATDANSDVNGPNRMSSMSSKSGIGNNSLEVTFANQD